MKGRNVSNERRTALMRTSESNPGLSLMVSAPSTLLWAIAAVALLLACSDDGSNPGNDAATGDVNGDATEEELPRDGCCL